MDWKYGYSNYSGYAIMAKGMAITSQGHCDIEGAGKRAQ